MAQVNQPEKVAIQSQTRKIGRVIPTKPAVKSDPVIKAAQQGFIAAGLLPTGADDGIMGPVTQKAYELFSEKHPIIREHVSFGTTPELARILTISRY
jgi:peptidoglycan hydrolase-like protein with peptidoglycan-binding domain